MSDFLFSFIGLICMIFITVFGFSSLTGIVDSLNDNYEKEIIEHGEEFTVYKECFELNDKFYCRNKE